MPSKKKRIATRQAQLSQRRRRERNRGRRTDDETGHGVAPRTEPAKPDVQRGGVANAAVAPALSSGPSIAAAAVEQPAMPRQPGRSRRRGAAARIEPVPTYPYLRAELRHIGIVAGVIIALLAGLTVILR